MTLDKFKNNVANLIQKDLCAAQVDEVVEAKNLNAYLVGFCNSVKKYWVSKKEMGILVYGEPLESCDWYSYDEFLEETMDAFYSKYVND